MTKKCNECSRRTALMGFLCLVCGTAWSRSASATDLRSAAQSIKQQSKLQELLIEQNKQEQMHFSEAIDKVVFESAWARRASWARGLSIQVVHPGTGPDGLTKPCVAMSAPTSTLPQRERWAWVPTQEDMFAEDWEIIPT
jgi:hypothetical protein